MLEQNSEKQTWADPKIIVFGDIASLTKTKGPSVLSDGVIVGPLGAQFPNFQHS